MERLRRLKEEATPSRTPKAAAPQELGERPRSESQGKAHWPAPVQVVSSTAGETPEPTRVRDPTQDSQGPHQGRPHLFLTDERPEEAGASASA